jgi:hypothetical protein
MRYEISRRRATSEEAAIIRRRFGIGVERWVENVALPLIPGAGACLVVMLLVGGLIRLFRGQGLTPEDTVWTLLTALVAGFAAWLGMFLELRRHRGRERVDVMKQLVEVIHAEDVRLAQQEEHGDEGPLYYFGIGEDKVLFLRGQWLWDWPIYGITPPEIDDDDEEGLGPPFPASSFTLSRLPLSGEVLRIDIKGAPLAPETTLGQKARLPAWVNVCHGTLGDSCLLDGSFDEIVRQQ